MCLWHENSLCQLNEKLLAFASLFRDTWSILQLMHMTRLIIAFLKEKSLFLLNLLAKTLISLKGSRESHDSFQLCDARLFLSEPFHAHFAVWWQVITVLRNITKKKRGTNRKFLQQTYWRFGIRHYVKLNFPWTTLQGSVRREFFFPFRFDESCVGRKAWRVQASEIKFYIYVSRTIFFSWANFRGS